MAKAKEKDLMGVESDGALAVASTDQLPAYGAEYAGEGAQDIEPSMSFNRIKVIQAMTDDDLKEQYGEGAMMLMPDEVLLADREGAFDATLLYQWRQWSQWRDANDPADLPVVETTFNADHPIAIKAASKETRTEEYADGTDRKYKFVEESCFAVRIEGSAEVDGTIAVIQFSRGGWREGRRLRDRLRRFGQQGVPVYAHRFQFKVNRAKNSSGQAWWQLTWEPQGFVTADQIASYQKMYKSIDTAFSTGALQPPTGDGDEAVE